MLFIFFLVKRRYFIGKDSVSVDLFGLRMIVIILILLDFRRRSNFYWLV